MKKNATFFIVISFLLILFSETVVAQDNSAYQSLVSGFKTPPVEARPKVYWWWLNGNVNNDRVVEEIKSMHDAGISGFDIFEIGVPEGDTIVKPGPAFLCDESLESIKVALEEAGKYNMEVGLNLASSWNAGGTWISPEHSAKAIFYSKTIVKEGQDNQMKLNYPEISKIDSKGRERLINYTKEGKPAFSQEIAVVAVPLKQSESSIDVNSVLDLSEFFDEESETLTWKNPGGQWQIYRFVCANSGEQLIMPSKYSKGPIMDHFDAESTKAHFTYIISRLQSVLGDLESSALNSMYLASYEASESMWTPSLPQIFEKINGYQINKYLPLIINDSIYEDQIINKFKNDFRRTVSELMINNCYKAAGEVVHQYGLKINSEAGGPGLPLHHVPVEPLKALGVLDLPRGEFWVNLNIFNDKGIDIMRVVKEISAASHIYNRKFVEEEAFTTFQHWQESPKDLKPVADRAFCEGMNRLVVHGFTHNTDGESKPGIVYHAGTHYNDKRIWWPKVKPFNDYLSRISYVFQNTDFVADVLYYYGDAIPNYGGHKNSRYAPGKGYDYEIVNTELLLQLTVENSELVLPTGQRFAVLYLEPEQEINPLVINKLDELLKAGAVILGNKPDRIKEIGSLVNVPKTKELINKLWENSDNKTIETILKKHSVVSNRSTSEVLNSIGRAKDVDYMGDELNLLDYIHYQKDGLHFYFLRNTTGEVISRTLSFRQDNKYPEIWNPVTGEINPVSVYSINNGRTEISLSFNEYESVLIVFKEGLKLNFSNNDFELPDNSEVVYLPDGLVLLNEESNKVKGSAAACVPLDGSWEIYFNHQMGTPEKVISNKLKSWTESDNQSIKYFSGSAIYEKTFQYFKESVDSSMVFLDLGEIETVGDVWLNGVHLGVSWCKPHRFDVTEILKSGNNTLKIEVCNTWSNRLKGDAVTGESNTYTNITKTNIQGLNRNFIEWKDVPLMNSGLLGPVNLIKANKYINKP